MIAVITDTHLKQGNEDQVYDIFRQAIKVCQDRDIHYLIHAGDFFTSRASQSLSVLLTTQKIFDLFRSSSVMLYIIPGNHCKTDLDSEDSYLDAFVSNKHITFIKKETSVDFGNDHQVFFIPYFKENEYLRRFANLETIEDQKNILITHIGVDGVKNNDYSHISNSLKQELFTKFDLVCVGHYHQRSQLADNIWYIGSSHPQNFGEDNEKGICIINEDLSLEFVNLNFPKYFTYRFDCKDIEQINSQLRQLFIGMDKIRFVITGNETEIDNFNRSIFNNYNVDVKFEKIYSQKTIELKKYKEDDIMLSFKQFCLDKNVLENIREKSINYLQKVL